MAKAKPPKEKLTPVPRRSKRPSVPATGNHGGAHGASACTPPDLSHITESLRDKAVSVADVAFLVGNCLTHPEEQIEELKASLRTFGQVEPLIVNRRVQPAVVIGGNGRLQAALALGWSHVAVTFVDLPQGKANALAIALNRTQEGSEWSKVDVEAMLRDMDTGNDEKLDKMMAKLATELKIVPPEEPTATGEGGDDFDAEAALAGECRVKAGDLWLIDAGRHRLLCGDSTDAATLELLMGGEKASLCHADPPYGINASSVSMGSGQSSKPKDKRLSHGQKWDGVRPDVSWLLQAAEWVCIWGGNYFSDVLPSSNDWLCWHKKNDGLSFSEFELAWTNYGKNCRHISHHWGAERKDHITQKPLAVVLAAIQLAPCDDGVILDPFLGSGTTMIAAHRTNRRCFGLEISEQYCEVILRRAEAEGLSVEKVEAAADTASQEVA